MNIRTILTSILAFFFILGSVNAQEIQAQLLPDSEMKIDGTSNVRDWDADVETIQAELLFENFESTDLRDLRPEHFKSMKLTMPVESIDSGSRRLTNNIHDYLKEDDHPNITFSLNEVTNIEWEDEVAVITAQGIINAAGKDHSVTMIVNATQNDGIITFSGEQNLKMTSFDIDPPTAVLGTIRAVDDFTVLYNIKFRI